MNSQTEDARRSREYYDQNIDRLRAKATARYRSNPKALAGKYRGYTEARKRRQSELLRTDPQFRIKRVISTRLHKKLRASGIKKNTRISEIIGCSMGELRIHLESLFEPGMSWKNHGVRGWHVDHKRPCASFDLSDPKQQAECFHYSNLQPLWWRVNLTKGSKIEVTDSEFQPTAP